MAISARGPADGAMALPSPVRRAIERAGYYPALVSDVVAAAVGPDEVRGHFVHAETTFDSTAVRRHITVLVITGHSLVIAHADDHDDDNGSAEVATATTEIVPLSGVRAVMVTHVVPEPASYRPGQLGREVTLTIGWGTVSRLDIVPATCGDPSCDADHGFEGTIASDDISLRISADADGRDAVTQALSFAQELSRVISPHA